MLDLVGEMQADGDACHRTVHGDGERPADPDEIAVARRQLLVRAGSKDGDLMATSPQPGGEETDVLGDASRMRVVIGRNYAGLPDRLALIALPPPASAPCGPSH